MQVSYIQKSVAVKFGLVIGTPNNYDPAKKYPTIVFLSGIVGRGDGSTSQLDRLYNYEVPGNLKEAVDKHGFLFVAPQTSGSYTSGEAVFAADYISQLYSVDTTRIYLTGLSLGGGGTVYTVGQSLANASKFAAAAPMAMTGQNVTWKNIVDAKLPMWFFHNSGDPTTSVSGTNNAVAAINGLNPEIPATKTIFNAGGHGGWDEAYNPNVIPTAYNGQGLTNPSVTLYEWLLMNSLTNKVKVPGQVAPSGLVAVAEARVEGDSIFLDGRKSSNYKSIDWKPTGVPEGVNFYNVSACAWVTCEVKLPKDSSTGKPKPGKYSFRIFAYPQDNRQGTPATADIVVDYVVNNPIPIPEPEPVPEPVPVIIKNVSLDFETRKIVITYSDGKTQTI